MNLYNMMLSFNILSMPPMFLVNVGEIVKAAILIGAVGIVLGLCLGIAAKFLAIEVDPKQEMVRDLLPGNNCGACGYAGCDSLAEAIAQGKAEGTACPVANNEAYAAIAEVMGVEATVKEKLVAFVKCGGTCDKTKVKYEYQGIEDCNKAMVAPGEGPKACSYGCLGFGSCVKACQFDALHIVDGIAVVDKKKCTSCGLCISKCPNKLIELVPQAATHKVNCNSNDKGKDVKAVCSVGCIGCMMCTKVCEFDAITVENNLASIDYSKCTGCGKCAQKCPTKIILSEIA